MLCDTLFIVFIIRWCGAVSAGGWSSNYKSDDKGEGEKSVEGSEVTRPSSGGSNSSSKGSIGCIR